MLLGVANGFVWSPLSTTATRNLPMQHAGAGAGIYNTTRQIGAVLGSAAIAVLMESRLAAEGLTFSPSQAGGGNLPQQVLVPFSEAMAQAMLLPAAILLIGLVAGLSFARPLHQVREQAPLTWSKRRSTSVAGPRRNARARAGRRPR